jgi:ribosome-binding factor A
MTASRPIRVAARIREELSELLSQRVNDPRVAGVLVTNVEVTPDLLDARIRVRLSTNDDPAARKAALKGLESASGFLRRELGGRLQLRNAPRLTFFYDESIERSRRIDEVLAEIAASPKAAKDPSEDE